MSNEMKRPDDLVYKSTPIELKEDGDVRYLEAVFSLFQIPVLLSKEQLLKKISIIKI